MLIREIDHALTTIHCTLDGMEAVIQMIMEVQTINADAVGYLLIGYISSIRQESKTIEETMKKL
jgi:hypothetical protein